MSYGYSQRVVEANRRAPKNLLGVALGRLCIDRNVPVAEVAEAIGVSRETVYNWFCGIHEPHPDLQETVNKAIGRIRALAKRK